MGALIRGLLRGGLGLDTRLLYHRLISCIGAIILRELVQTSHAGGGLKPGGKKMIERTAASQSGGAQEVLEIDAKVQLNQVDVELFGLYAIRKFGHEP